MARHRKTHKALEAPIEELPDQDDEDQHSPEQAEEGDRLEEDDLEKRAAEQQLIRMNRRGLWIEREKAARARRK